MHEVSVLSSEEDSDDNLKLSDFLDDEDPDLNDRAKGLSWSSFWMVVSRKTAHVFDGLPVPAVRSQDAAQSPSSKTKQSAQTRAQRLARARAQEHAQIARRNARIAGGIVSGALAILMVASTPSQSTLPGAGDLADADSYILLTPMERTSVHVASVQYSQPERVSSGLLVPASMEIAEEEGAPLKTGSKSDDAVKVQNVNRDEKDDLQMTRPPAIASQPNPDLPFSGNVFELRDLFSAVNEELLPRTALAAPGWPSSEQINIATNHFSAPGVVLQRSRVMVAKAVRESRPSKAAPPPQQPVQVALAYAPVQDMEEFKSPFAVVLNMAPKHAAPVIAKQEPSQKAPTIDPVTTGSIQTASLSPKTADKNTSKAPTAKKLPAKISIAGRIPVARPNLDDVQKSKKGGIATVKVRRPDLNPGAHWWVTNKLPRAAYSRREQRCLAAAIYFEARGEETKGQAAVAQVVLNRVKAPAYPSTICGVVYQNKKWRNRCQFSFACDGIRDRTKDKKSYKQAKKIAKSVTRGKTWLKSVGSSTHYHATYVSPKWAKKMKRMTKIGTHIFYRTHKGGWS